MDSLLCDPFVNPDLLYNPPEQETYLSGIYLGHVIMITYLMLILPDPEPLAVDPTVLMLPTPSTTPYIQNPSASSNSVSADDLSSLPVSLPGHGNLELFQFTTATNRSKQSLDALSASQDNVKTQPDMSACFDNLSPVEHDILASDTSEAVMDCGRDQ